MDDKAINDIILFPNDQTKKNYVICGEIVSMDRKYTMQATILIDALLFNLYSLVVGSEENAIIEIKKAMKNGLVGSSKAAKNLVAQSICKPEIWEEYENRKEKFKIEDF